MTTQEYSHQAETDSSFARHKESITKCLQDGRTLYGATKAVYHFCAVRASFNKSSPNLEKLFPEKPPTVDAINTNFLNRFSEQCQKDSTFSLPSKLLKTLDSLPHKREDLAAGRNVSSEELLVEYQHGILREIIMFYEPEVKGTHFELSMEETHKSGAEHAKASNIDAYTTYVSIKSRFGPIKKSIQSHLLGFLSSAFPSAPEEDFESTFPLTSDLEKCENYCKTLQTITDHESNKQKALCDIPSPYKVGNKLDFELGNSYPQKYKEPIQQRIDGGYILEDKTLTHLGHERLKAIMYCYGLFRLAADKDQLIKDSFSEKYLLSREHFRISLKEFTKHFYPDNYSKTVYQEKVLDLLERTSTQPIHIRLLKIQEDATREGYINLFQLFIDKRTTDTKGEWELLIALHPFLTENLRSFIVNDYEEDRRLEGIFSKKTGTKRQIGSGLLPIKAYLGLSLRRKHAIKKGRHTSPSSLWRQDQKISTLYKKVSTTDRNKKRVYERLYNIIESLRELGMVSEHSLKSIDEVDRLKTTEMNNYLETSCSISLNPEYREGAFAW